MAVQTALARTPEIAFDPREGVWVAAGEVFIHQARDRWSVFPAPATVNEIAVDDLTAWVATDDGVVRFESGSRRMGQLGMDDGLPSQLVTAVAFDDLYVWFGTNKGLARYRKHDRTIRVYSDEDGLPHRGINDILRIGREVWFATRSGLAVYDPEVDGFRAFTTEDGLLSDYVEELYALGEDLWCRTDEGLSRLQIKSRRFTSFTFEDLGGEEIRVFQPEGERVWLGTENGLSTFESTSDAFVPFPQQGALESRSIFGVEPFGDYVFIVTDTEVVQYNELKSSFRRYTEEADGITREAGAIGTVLTSGQLTMMFADGVQLYDIARDLWTTRSLGPTEGGDEGRTSWQLWLKGDGEVPINARTGKASEDRYGTGEAGFGVGYQFEDGRSLDITGELDYGEIELHGIRDVDVKAEYLGTKAHLLREVQIDDELEVRTLEDGIDEPARLLGGRARLASSGSEPTFSSTVDGGVRRGISEHNFFTGPRLEVYQLYRGADRNDAVSYVLPGSERVYLDGELLTAGRDYEIIYPAGRLAFLDPEKVDDLSIIEVEYEYDVIPKKGLGVISILDLLPADNEVGSWVQSSEPTVISEESGLYNQIDGAAPKYIDRGWKRSVYAEYRQGSRSIQLAIHDMEVVPQAEDIYNYDLPAAREQVLDTSELEDTDAALDIGLASSYVVKARQGVFYIEISIDEKSDPAKQSLRLFTLQVLERGDTAGESDVSQYREAYAATRVGWSPARGLEIGARAVEVVGIADSELDGMRADGDASIARRREQLTGVLDTRYETELGEGGRLTAYAEGAASHGQRAGNRDGFATMGRLRVSHPWLDGSLEARFLDPEFATLASNDAFAGTDSSGAVRTGKLRDEMRLAATAYPLRWLPTSVFFSRRSARVEDSGDAAVVQQALGRLQLAHKSLPATSVQVGHTMVDNAVGGTTNRLKIAGDFDYDFAEGILSPLGMRRFIVRGVMSFSDALTKRNGNFSRGDQVLVSRLEAKLAPTSTETAYALFRSRISHAQEREGEEPLERNNHWELNAGARSAIVPGVIPQVNYTVVFDRDRPVDELSTTGRLGDSIIRTSNGSISGQLGIYPGDWWDALAPVAIDTRYSMGEEARSDQLLPDPAERQTLRRLHRVDNRMSYVGTGAWEVELREIYELGLAGEAQKPDSQRIELRNRFVFRPTHSSPIVLRLDYIEEMAHNDRSLNPTAPRWTEQRVYEAALESLMRWDRRWTTKLKTTYTINEVLRQVDQTTGEVSNSTQYLIKPEEELRFLLQRESGSLFLFQRGRLPITVDDAAGDTTIGCDVSVGLIWSEADNIYLDAEVTWRDARCFEGDSDPEIVPRLLFTAKL